MLSGPNMIAPCFFFNSLSNFRTAIALSGKLFAAGNFSVVYMYTAEIYPTIIRFGIVFLFSISYLIL